MAMTKTQVYFPPEELRALHRVARRRRQPVAALVREAVRATWLRPALQGPVALWDGPISGGSVDHDGALADGVEDP
jgi:hypothetical protein